jgi:hypothetical protein
MDFKMLATLLLLQVLSAKVAPDALAQPSGPGDYNSGHFLMDASRIGKPNWASWFAPGDDYCRAKNGTQCDGTPADAKIVKNATNTWNAMKLCDQVRVRLYHDAQIKRIHPKDDRVAWLYTTSLPDSLDKHAKECSNPKTFEFIGGTFSAACSALDKIHNDDLCKHFWPHGVMDERVFGWEADGK